MLCVKCGNQEIEGAAFCTACGARMAEAAATPSPQAQTYEPQAYIPQPPTEYMQQPPTGYMPQQTYTRNWISTDKPEAKTITMAITVIIVSAIVIIAGVLVGLYMLRDSGAFGIKKLTVDEMLDLGEKYLLDLDYERALVEFLKVIEIEPMNPHGYTGAAEAYVGLGNKEGAVTVLQDGLRELPGNAEIQNLLEEIELSLSGDESKQKHTQTADGALSTGKPITIEIVQVDSSDFPIVRLYVSIYDEKAQVVEGAAQGQFEVLELDASGHFTPVELQELLKLLARYSMSVNLVVEQLYNL